MVQTPEDEEPIPNSLDSEWNEMIKSIENGEIYLIDKLTAEEIQFQPESYTSLESVAVLTAAEYEPFVKARRDMGDLISYRAAWQFDMGVAAVDDAMKMFDSALEICQGLIGADFRTRSWTSNSISTGKIPWRSVSFRVLKQSK